MIQILRAHGLPEPERQYVVSVGPSFMARVDLAYPAWRIAIEYESFEWHLGAEALARDSARRNALTSADWVVLAATAAEIRQGGGQLCAAVRSASRRSGVGKGA